VLTPSIAPKSAPNTGGEIASNAAEKPPRSATISITVLMVIPPTKPARPVSSHQSQR
jgi:hypothetical protein